MSLHKQTSVSSSPRDAALAWACRKGGLACVPLALRGNACRLHPMVANDVPTSPPVWAARGWGGTDEALKGR